MSKAKITVFKLKDLLLTAVLVFSGIAILLLIVALVSLKNESTPNLTGHSVNNDSTQTSAPLYYPGVYTTTMEVNDTIIHMELVCDENHINSVRLINLDEAVETMYPLLNPALEDLELQLSLDVPVEELEFTEGSTYTQTLLVEAITQALDKAEVVE